MLNSCILSDSPFTLYGLLSLRLRTILVTGLIVYRFSNEQLLKFLTILKHTVALESTVALLHGCYLLCLELDKYSVVPL